MRVYALELAELDVVRRYTPSQWQQQHEINPEKRIHESIELYQVWLAKTEFVERAIRADPFGSDVYAWADIGGWRQQTPLERYLVHLNELRRHSVLFVTNFSPKSLKIDENKLFIKGTPGHSNAPINGRHFVAHRDTWHVWSTAFCTVVDQHILHGVFAGEDQAVMTTTCKRYSSLCSFARRSFAF
ncbi:hypothetical protein T492DRAFT_1013020 [Pavlovales sp. CCMP2436]|nr:hypothetical protein T492DRAFT_1013020 [Pavlovales sp. CCMP2436]